MFSSRSSIKLYIDITISIYSALSIWVLFISSYAASKWETIFKYYFFIPITTAPEPALLLTVIFPLASIYASL